MTVDLTSPRPASTRHRRGCGPSPGSCPQQLQPPRTLGVRDNAGAPLPPPSAQMTRVTFPGSCSAAGAHLHSSQSPHTSVTLMGGHPRGARAQGLAGRRATVSASGPWPPAHAPRPRRCRCRSLCPTPLSITSWDVPFPGNAPAPAPAPEAKGFLLVCPSTGLRAQPRVPHRGAETEP